MLFSQLCQHELYRKDRRLCLTFSKKSLLLDIVAAKWKKPAWRLSDMNSVFRKREISPPSLPCAILTLPKIKTLSTSLTNITLSCCETILMVWGDIRTVRIHIKWREYTSICELGECFYNCVILEHNLIISMWSVYKGNDAAVEKLFHSSIPHLTHILLIQSSTLHLDAHLQFHPTLNGHMAQPFSIL